MSRYLVFTLLAIIAQVTLPEDASAQLGHSDRVTLVGASVGLAWNFPAHFPDYNFEYLGPIYQFDKSDGINELLARTGSDRPRAIIIKECAAYFPETDPATYEALVPGWVAQIRAAGIIPLLATACPVTVDLPADQFDAIEAYDVWVRAYAAGEHISVADLNRALWTSASDHHLDPSCAQDDGLHLLNWVYAARLDAVMLAAIQGAFATGISSPAIAPQPIGSGTMLAVWPNPASSGSRVWLAAQGLASTGDVSVCDVRGVVQRVPVTLVRGGAWLDVRGLATGTYLVRTRVDRAAVVTRLALMR